MCVLLGILCNIKNPKEVDTTTLRLKMIKSITNFIVKKNQMLLGVILVLPTTYQQFGYVVNITSYHLLTVDYIRCLAIFIEICQIESQFLNCI